jgi:hypothetical protein
MVRRTLAPMAKVFDSIDDRLQAWIERQALFFVGSAPLAADGHVNVSPKGPIGSLRVLGPHRVAYLDISGSGAETVAHVRENGRIVVMFCAFQGPPRIVRLHGTAEVVFPEDARYGELLAQAAFEDASIPEARRSIVVVDVTRVSDACGYGVPLMTLDGHREHHALSSAKKLRVKGQERVEAERRQRGARSLDGLPALER